MSVHRPGRPWRSCLAALAIAGLAASAVVAVIAAVPAAAASPVPAGSRVVSHRSAGAPGTGGTCAAPNYDTIQAAVDASVAGDTIYVCAGRYHESVMISRDNLTIDGPQAGYSAQTGRTVRADEAVIHSASTVISVDQRIDSVTLDGLELRGSAASTVVASGADSGVLTVRNSIIDGGRVAVADTGTDAVIINDRVQHLVGHAIVTAHAEIAENRFIDNAIDLDLQGGAQAVHDNVSRGSEAFLTMAHTNYTTITDNVVRNPIGAGMAIEGINFDAVVSGNTITGSRGPGIKSSNLCCTSDDERTSYRITIADNTIANSQYGILIAKSPSADFPATLADSTISGNLISGSTDAGIKIAARAGLDDTVRDNRVSGSGGSDCADATTGSQTAGTANTWTSNVGRTGSPAGLCTPPTVATTLRLSSPHHGQLLAAAKTSPARSGRMIRFYFVLGRKYLLVSRHRTNAAGVATVKLTGLTSTKRYTMVARMIGYGTVVAPMSARVSHRVR